MRKAWMCLSVVFFLLCGGCGGVGAKVTPPRAVWELADEINQTRADLYADGWEAEEEALFRSYCPDGAGQEPNWDSLCARPPEQTAYLTDEEARQDVAALFEALRAAYGGYAYFGGDRVFVSVEAEVLQAAEAAQREDGALPRRQLAQILRQHLSEYIRDSHFGIRRERLNQGGVQTYYVPGLVFGAPGEVGGVPNELIRRTISPTGELAYGLLALSQTGEDLPQSAEVDGAWVPLTWVRAEPVGFSGPICSTSRENGVPVLGLRGFSASGSQEERALSAFANGGVKYRGEPILVLDLRGNGGGNDAYPLSWLAGYLGSPAHAKELRATRYTGLMLNLLKQVESDQSAIQEAEKRMGTCVVSSSERTVGENEGIIFVLVDHRTASAAEGFLFRLRAVENTIVVGSNTAGCIGFGNVSTIYLPHSGIPVQFGATISFRERLESVEGRGILPDLWVPPEEALRAVLALCGVESGK